MCELLGLDFNRPVCCSLSFRGFRDRGEHNPHGWGVARYEGPVSQVFKEPCRAGASGLSRFLRDYEPFTSTVFVAHVRRASRGATALCNTHPFVRTFRGRDLVLAHNGTLSGLPAGSLGFHPVGETDSELLLCRLLARLSAARVALTDHAELEEVLRELNGYGAMNLLVSDGEHLFAYRDAGGYNGLCTTRRRAPFDIVRLRDEDWQVDLAEHKGRDPRGYVFATRPLTDEPWTEIEAGTLVVFRGGDLVYGGQRPAG
jgi:predicted glutamine amidotransferase